MRIKSLALFTLLFCTIQNNYSQNKGWIKRADCPYSVNDPSFYFSYANKIYIGKYSGANISDSIFCYDKATNAWAYNSQFPGTSHFAEAIVVGTKAYLISGRSSVIGFPSINSYSKEVWEYDIPNNIWTQKGNFPGSGRIDHRLLYDISSNKIYLSFGYGYSALLSGSDYYEDLWSYDLNTYSFTQLASFTSSGVATARYGHTFYIRGNKLYVKDGAADFPTSFVTGVTGEYNILTNMWTSTGSIGLWSKRKQHFSYLIKNNLYIGMGGISTLSLGPLIYQDCFMSSSSTTVSFLFPGIERYDAIGVSCLGNGFVGIGVSYNQFYTPTKLKDWWEFTGLILKKDVVSTSSNTLISILPLSNDADLNYGFKKSTLSVASNPIHGTYTIDTLNSIINYTSNNNFVGIDSLKYVICNLNPFLSNCDTASVRINVGSSSSILKFNIENEKISLIPNPSEGKVSISSNNSIIGKIIIYNHLSQEVFRSNDANNSELDISFLSSGIYYLECKTNLSSKKIKLIKQ
jgi:hypothetical protein